MIVYEANEDGFCGPATLQTLTGIAQLEIARVMQTGEGGTSHEGMLLGIGYLGYQGLWRTNVNIEDLTRHQGKVILNYMDGPDPENDGHYAAYAGIREGNILLDDSDVGGTIEVPLERFVRSWYDKDGNNFYNRPALFLY